MEHAWFSAYDTRSRRATGSAFNVQINPETYSISAQNKHQVKRESGTVKQQPIYFTFLARDPSTISVELVFDTYRHGQPEAKMQNVRESYAPLRKFLSVSSEEHAPPVLLFAWGRVAFVGVLTQMEENFTMFISTGTPVRAKVKVTMEGCPQEDLQSRALHSPDRTKVRMVCQNDTLWAMARREYDSPALWRPIALANGIRNPRKLPQAQRIVVPPLTEGS